MPANDAARDKWQTYHVDAIAGQFGVKVAAILAGLGTNAETMKVCELVIDHFAEQILTMAEARFGGPSTSATFISDLRTKMLQYREYSVGEAYRLFTPQLETGPSAFASNQPPAPLKPLVAEEAKPIAGRHCV